MHDLCGVREPISSPDAAVLHGAGLQLAAKEDAAVQSRQVVGGAALLPDEEVVG
jgi:hypothetical protein